MTKAELVTQVALKTELTKQETAEVVDLLLQCIIEASRRVTKSSCEDLAAFAAATVVRVRAVIPKQVRPSRSQPKPFPFLRPERCFRLD